MTRETMPSAYDIAEYWYKNQPEGSQMVVDLGEPACMACGWYNQIDPPETVAFIHKAWEHKYSELQKCHMTPHALGGSVDVSNVVLMCRLCHVEAPDYIDPHHMLEWICNRAPDSDFERYMGMFSNPELKPIVMEYINGGGSPEEFCRRYIKELAENAVPHWGWYSESTRITAAKVSLESILTNSAA